MACNSRNNNSTPAFCCATTGACQKTCVEVKKVFDACISQTSELTTIQVEFPGATEGYNVTSVKSTGNLEISNLTIAPITGSINSEVSFDLSVPVTVVATNTAGSQIVGTGTMTFSKDIVLKVPSDGIISPTIEVTAVVEGLQNTLAGTEVTTNACVTIITKVVAEVILAIQSYGYPVLPPCQEYTQDVCSGVFSAPIYPV